jgi:hypothetical protein
MPTNFFVFLKPNPKKENAIFFKYDTGKTGMPTKIGHKLKRRRTSYAGTAI